MTQHNVSFQVPFRIGTSTLNVNCIASPVQGGPPVLMWAEIDGSAAPLLVWDAIEAQIAAPGAIRDLFLAATSTAPVPHVAA